MAKLVAFGILALVVVGTQLGGWVNYGDFVMKIMGIN